MREDDGEKEHGRALMKGREGEQASGAAQGSQYPLGNFKPAQRGAAL